VAVAFPITGFAAAGLALLAIGANTARAANAMETLEIVRAPIDMDFLLACLPAVTTSSAGRRTSSWAVRPS
jgi:hypothetical protein